jgi:hypothetical protein
MNILGTKAENLKFPFGFKSFTTLPFTRAGGISRGAQSARFTWGKRWNQSVLENAYSFFWMFIDSWSDCCEDTLDIGQRLIQNRSDTDYKMVKLLQWVLENHILKDMFRWHVIFWNITTVNVARRRAHKSHLTTYVLLTREERATDLRFLQKWCLDEDYGFPSLSEFRL